MIPSPSYPEKLPLPRYALVILILIMILSYAVMIDKYGFLPVDDAWTLSFDYYYLSEGYEFDRISGSGAAVLAYFGKTHALVYGAWAKLFAWGRNEHRLLSSIFVFFAAILWGSSASRLFKRQIAGWMVFFFCILFDIFVSMGTKTRPEALIMLFCAIALRLFLARRYLAAGIVASLAVEIHPIAIAGLIILVSMALAQHGIRIFTAPLLRRLVLPTALGSLVGVLYYFVLHYQHIGSLLSLSQFTKYGDYILFSFLEEHFIHARYSRHIPDLIIALGGYAWLGIHWKRLGAYRVPARFVLFMTAGVLLFAFFFTRGNENYACMIYPALVTMYTIIALYYHKTFLILAAVCLLVLPQYAYVAWLNRNINFNEYMELVRQHLPASDELLVGHPIYWFAVVDDPQHEFYTTMHPKIPVKGRSYYYIHSDGLHAEKESPYFAEITEALRSAGRIEPYARFTYAGKEIRIDWVDFRQHYSIEEELPKRIY